MFCSLLIITWLYDWIFINLEYFLPSGLITLLKMYQEFLIAIIFLVILVNTLKRGKATITKLDKLFFYYILLPLSISLVISIANKNEYLISGIKSFITPIFFPYILFKAKLFENINFSKVKDTFSLILIVTVLFAFYQSISFDGDLSKLWFYEFINQKGDVIEKGFYNYVKGENLRATSFFVSAINLTTISALLSSFFLINFLRNKKISHLLLSLIGIIGVYYSRTRMGYAIIGLDIVIYIFMKCKMKNSNLLYLVPFIAVFFTFYLISITGLSDLSSLSRLNQYTEFLYNFEIMGAGIGDYKSVFSFDSFYLCTLYAMGILGFSFFIFYFKIVNKNLKITFNNIKNNDSDSKNIFIIVNILTFIYVFAFHHIAGSIIQNLLFLLLFLQISEYSERKDIKND
ncbi:MAG: hypothetical protein PHT02_13805 [Tissierellia bacterium]|nr:hypothetical protein [Tissierellia bacterium]